MNRSVGPYRAIPGPPFASLICLQELHLGSECLLCGRHQRAGMEPHEREVAGPADLDCVQGNRAAAGQALSPMHESVGHAGSILHRDTVRHSDVIRCGRRRANGIPPEYHVELQFSPRLRYYYCETVVGGGDYTQIQELQ